MTEKFDVMINKKQSELEALKSNMEKIKQQFIGQSADLISKLYEKIAKEYVTTESENTIKLGKEKLSLLKNEIKALSNNSKEIAEEFLSSESLWWHLDPTKPKAYNAYLVTDADTYTIYPDSIDRALRKALGKLGIILEKFGYAVTTTDYYSSHRMTRNKQWCLTPTKEEPNPFPYFPDNLDWSEEMKKLINDYKTQYDNAKNLHFDILKLEGQKAEKQANDLWDSV